MSKYFIVKVKCQKEGQPTQERCFHIVSESVPTENALSLFEFAKENISDDQVITELQSFKEVSQEEYYESQSKVQTKGEGENPWNRVAINKKTKFYEKLQRSGGWGYERPHRQLCCRMPCKHVQQHPWGMQKLRENVLIEPNVLVEGQGSFHQPKNSMISHK